MALPLPGSFGEAFNSGMNTGSTMIERMMQNKLREAQTNRANKMAELPFGGANVPGPAGQIVGLEMIKQMYGKDSDQYKQAQQAFEMSQKAIGSRVGYQDALTGSMGLRYTTPEGRGMIEESNVSQGASPAGTPMGKPIVPGAPGFKSPYATPEQAAGQYQAERIKKNIPGDVLKRNLYATNIEKTLQNINVDDLTAYGGAKGFVQRGMDAGKSASGTAPERYAKYQEALTAADTLAKQVRQFYGDSITPSVQAGLKEMANPSTWLNNPEVAKRKFNKFKSILQQEMGTYRDATKGAAVYQGQPEQSGIDEQSLPPEQSASSQDDLERYAQEAIAQGADPAAVQAEMQKLRGGAR